jgi:hypothetical protein
MPAILRTAGRAWGAVFTDRYLRSLRDSVDRTFRQAAVDSQAIHAWTASIQSAALALPPGNIQDAIDLLHQVDEIELPGEAKFLGNYWKESLRRCNETLQMRQRIDGEIRA